MKTTVSLKQERKSLKDEGAAIVTKAKTENRELTADEQTRFDVILNDITNFDNQIEAAEKREKFEASLAGQEVNTTKEVSEVEKFSFSKMVNEYANNKTVTGFERELIQESAKEARSLGVTDKGGIYLSNNFLDIISKRGTEKRTVVAGTNSLGGFMIPTEKLGFFDSLFAMSVLDQLGVTKLTGLSSNTDLPGFSVAVTSAWASETGTQTATDPTFVNRTLRPKLLYAAADISRQMLIQTNSSVDALILNNIQKSLKQALEAAVINGGGSNQPTGIIATSGTTSVSIGTNGGALTYAKLLELVQAVGTANADLSNAKFLTNYKVAGKAKQTSIDAGSGAFIMGYNNYFGGVQNVMDNTPTFLTANVPSNLTKGSSGAVCSALIYGDFSQVYVGQFGGIEIMIDSTSAALARAGQIGITVNQFVDAAIAQPAAIGTIEDLTTT